MTFSETVGRHRVEVFSDDLARWERCVSELDEQGVAVPLEHRPAWLREVARGRHLFAAAWSEADGSPSAAFPLDRLAARSLPGHFRLGATRLGYAAEDPGLLATLGILPAMARRHSGLLGISLELFLAETERRSRIEEQLRGLGFHRARRRRTYRFTLRVDLTPDEAEILSSFSGTCRRFIRDPEKKGYRMEPVVDDRWSSRMDRLWRETFSRTGRSPPPRDWAGHVQFARRHPDLYRIVGMFGPGYPADGSLKAFACARNNRDHAVYSDGASTRDVPPGVALAYAPMWSLMTWARARACAWFDLGGIPARSHQEAEGVDPRAGISEFKRRFTEQVIEVGSEWVFEARPLRSRLVRGLSSSASAVRSLLPGFRG